MTTPAALAAAGTPAPAPAVPAEIRRSIVVHRDAAREFGRFPSRPNLRGEEISESDLLAAIAAALAQRERKPVSRPKHIRASMKPWCLFVLIQLLGLTPLAAQGTDYQPTLGKFSYGLFKSTIGATVYATAREAGISRTKAAILGIVGPLIVGKAIAWGQGHRVPPLDILHDAAWFGVFVLPLASRKPGRLVISASLILFTCHGASPRMC